MLSLKIIFFVCETTIGWRKMQITAQLSLNETSQKKNRESKGQHPCCVIIQIVFKEETME